MDLLLKENFELKREIVFERKKFVDLNSAYTDLKKNIEEGNEVFPSSINEEFENEMINNEHNSYSVQVKKNMPNDLQVQLKENMSISPDRRPINNHLFQVNQGSNTHGVLQRGA